MHLAGGTFWFWFAALSGVKIKLMRMTWIQAGGLIYKHTTNQHTSRSTLRFHQQMSLTGFFFGWPLKQLWIWRWFLLSCFPYYNFMFLQIRQVMWLPHFPPFINKYACQCDTPPEEDGQALGNISYMTDNVSTHGLCWITDSLWFLSIHVHLHLTLT